MRSAMASKRVLLVDIPHPIPFTTFFTPAKIDWGMGDIVVPADAKWWSGEGRVARLQSNEALLEPNRFVAVQGHGEIHILPIVGAPNITWLGLPSHCVFHALFRPSEQVQKVGVVWCYVGVCGREGSHRGIVIWTVLIVAKRKLVQHQSCVEACSEACCLLPRCRCFPDCCYCSRCSCCR